MYFEEFDIGQTFQSRGRTIQETDITQFSSLTWDHAPIHTNEEVAREKGFDGIIAHGPMTLAMCLALSDGCGWFEDSGIAFLGIQDLEFNQPVYPGDTIRSTVEIDDTQESSDGTKGVITQTRTGIKESGETFLEFQCKHLVAKKDA